MVGFLVYSDCFTMVTFSTSDVLATVMMALSFSSSLRCWAQRFRNVFSSPMLALSWHGVRGLCCRFRGFGGFGGVGVLYAGFICLFSLICFMFGLAERSYAVYLWRSACSFFRGLGPDGMAVSSGLFTTAFSTRRCD